MRAQNLWRLWKRHPSISNIYGQSSLCLRTRYDPEECNLQAIAIVLNLRLSPPFFPLEIKFWSMLKAENFHFLKLSQGIQGSELRTWGWAMQDRDVWRGIVNSMKATMVEQWWWSWCLRTGFDKFQISDFKFLKSNSNILICDFRVQIFVYKFTDLNRLYEFQVWNLRSQISRIESLIFRYSHLMLQWERDLWGVYTPHLRSFLISNFVL